MKNKLKSLYRGVLLAAGLSMSVFASALPVRNDFSFKVANAVTGSILESVLPFSFDPIANITYMKKMEVYDSLQLHHLGLSQEAFDYAIRGLQRLAFAGVASNTDIISIADFSLPSAEKRLFVIDLANSRLLYHTFVAHGKNSGKEVATRFSNGISSFKSSPGFYLTADTYLGSHGYSLKLQGLEKGINDNALKRAIVMHAADYVNENLAGSRGWIGRSLGCPAVPKELHREIIDQIKGGTCLFIYSPAKSYVNKSTLIAS